ncbi:hypothetical protein EVAR_45906_1 [Eumeta japonica]|uniref:Uncharacterized protein n=1 Tax=Eumeta variegata TaxID=151549 RepID=A0A4C1XV17_EUMVA|nr:hypothetical protein EVAR_45906_1 [Eumeta japonica]
MLVGGTNVRDRYILYILAKNVALEPECARFDPDHGIGIEKTAFIGIEFGFEIQGGPGLKLRTRPESEQTVELPYYCDVISPR